MHLHAQPGDHLPQSAVSLGLASPTPRLSHATSTTTAMIQAITKEVLYTLSYSSIDIEDTVCTCLEGVGDRFIFVFISVFISVFSTLVSLFLCLLMCFCLGFVWCLCRCLLLCLFMGYFCVSVY